MEADRRDYIKTAEADRRDIIKKTKAEHDAGSREKPQEVIAGDNQQDVKAGGMQAEADGQNTEMKKVRFRALWIALGCICFALGTVGVVLPILPTTPFYLATLFCFAKGSQKLHDWFVGTKLYKDHLESFVKKEGMLMKTKLSIVVTVTLLMGFGFFMMARKGIWLPCVILAVVWLGHIIYFFGFVKTIGNDKQKEGFNNK